VLFCCLQNILVHNTRAELETKIVNAKCPKAPSSAAASTRAGSVSVFDVGVGFRFFSVFVLSRSAFGVGFSAVAVRILIT
jgi:hypothetical protein